MLNNPENMPSGHSDEGPTREWRKSMFDEMLELSRQIKCWRDFFNVFIKTKRTGSFLGGVGYSTNININQEPKSEPKVAHAEVKVDKVGDDMLPSIVKVSFSPVENAEVPDAFASVEVVWGEKNEPHFKTLDPKYRRPENNRLGICSHETFRKAVEVLTGKMEQPLEYEEYPDAA